MKVYVELTLEVEGDNDDGEEYISDNGWADINRLEGLWDVMPGVIDHIGMPSRVSRKELSHAPVQR